MKIIAIESSCDETAVAIIGEKNNLPIVLSSVVSSQIDIHAQYGGVVPEVAARAHIQTILPILKKALNMAGLTLSEIDYLAFTYGPGLIGSLVVGVETAKGLSAACGLSLVPVNHLEGHVYANFIKEDSQMTPPEFPLLTLLVSGGHTLLIYLKNHLEYQVVGQTIDDAAGEAFDKAAKAMGLPYPGGPVIAKLAESGDENRFSFPVIDLTPPPKRDENSFLQKSEPSLDFSFSGLKTSLITKVKELRLKRETLTNKEIADLSASFEKTVIETLVQNSQRAKEKYQPKSFIISGGVAANKKLRQAITEKIDDKNTKVYVPKLAYCTDNAAMIGAAAYFHIKLKKIS